MIDCDWCAYARERFQSKIPDHVGMMQLCTKCARNFEMQRLLRAEAA